MLSISNDALQNLPVEELIDLKIETEMLVSRVDSILELCKKTLNS